MFVALEFCKVSHILLYPNMDPYKAKVGYVEMNVMGSSFTLSNKLECLTLAREPS